MPGKVKLKSYELSNDFLDLALKNRVIVIKTARSLLKQQQEEKAKTSQNSALRK